jgi:hypothetical protein
MDLAPEGCSIFRGMGLNNKTVSNQSYQCGIFSQTAVAVVDEMVLPWTHFSPEKRRKAMQAADFLLDGTNS